MAQDNLISKLEIYNLETNSREVVLEDQSHFEAPNWLNKEELIINSQGILYKYNFIKKTKTKIDTGFAVHCNNDHGVFPDGKNIILSNNDQDQKEYGQSWGTSRIYKVPLTGGVPEKITILGPSYWHGISPDGNIILYTAMRNSEFDVYKMSIQDKVEIKLTSEFGLDDGPEYSFDGKYIFYNSMASGKMELWKMDPNGKNKTQLTNDKYSNWFPHPSPDGKYLVFISYVEDQGEKHPPLKKVMLRLLNLETLYIKELTRFIGGQGTINVPSWSSDSKKFAFVSYMLK
jgi:TolB protein